MTRQELLNSADYWQGIAENQCYRENINCTLQLVDKKQMIDKAELKDYNSIDPHFGKPIDKVEPKFKVGDWIIQENIGVYKVIEICKSWYEVINTEDNHYSISFDKEYMCHLWSIEDAKDGDVLTYDDGWTCIFKCIHGVWYSSYCFITADGEFNPGYEEHSIDSTINGNGKPATKEQRDFLFQRMKESGYKWNFDKKELKI